MTDAIRKQLHGTTPPLQPNPDWCDDLGSETYDVPAAKAAPKSTAAPIAHSVFEVHPRLRRSEAADLRRENDAGRADDRNAIIANRTSKTGRSRLCRAISTGVLRDCSHPAVSQIKPRRSAWLDQRTFECEWQTLVTLSRHRADYKIELFYFLAQSGWTARCPASRTTPY
jgi:hypothetical protein